MLDPQSDPQPDPQSAGTPPAANAPQAPSPAGSSGIEEMLVHGGGHEDLLQDVGVSVSSFDASDLKALRIQNIADLSEYTPNLEINTAFAASNPNIFIRGIGLKDYNANAAGAVAVYQDGININAPAIQLGQLFDIDSIEVLRGPQGSVNGRNATAGAILINSALPGDEFEATGSFSYGNYNNLQGEAAISVPIIPEMLSIRIAGTANFRDGTLTNECAGWDPLEHGFVLGGGPEPTGPSNVTSAERMAFLTAAGVDPVASAASTQQLYQALIPTPGQVTVRSRIAGTNYVTDEFVFLNGALSDDLRRAGIANAGQTFKRNQNSPGATLVNPVTLPDGRMFPAGTEVALVSNPTSTPMVDLDLKAFALNALAADQVCILKAPGRVVTGPGELETNPAGAAGQYIPFPASPELSEFQGLDRKLNDIANWAGRGILRLTPMDGMEWIVNGHYGQNLGGASHLQMLGADAFEEGGFFGAAEDLFSEARASQILTGAGAEGFEGTTKIKGIDPSSTDPVAFPGDGGDDPFRGFYNRDGDEDLDAWGISVRGQWDLAPFVITTLSGYETYDRRVEDEGDANPLEIFAADYDDSAWQWSTELRIEGEGEGYQWGLGYFYLHEELDAFNLFPGVRQVILEQTFDQELTSFAFYGNGRYWLTPELSLEGGVRWNSEKKKFGLESIAAPENPMGTPFDEVPENVQRKRWTAWTGGATLYYEPSWDALELIHNDKLNLYVKYAHGFKGGHFNANTTFRADGAIPEITPVDPEFIDAVEIGWKTSWLEDRLAFNVAGFRYWYKDLQVFDITNSQGGLPVPQLLNADARVWGAELELNMRPLPGLLVQFSGGFLDAKFGKFTVTKVVRQGGMSGGQGSNKLVTFDYEGNPLISAPTWNASTIVEYQIPLLSYGTLVPQYDFSVRSKVYLDPQKLDPISQNGYWLHNARLAYRTPDGRIELAGWVQNFLDQEYKIDVFDVTREFNTILEVWGDPRTYGLTLTLTW